ncbi:MAG: hypothetical protein U5K79_05970 [Cyclobacteriaceae bacterium]|nr:hypothetical protein [Cyclobacteriaceae bacterium]
MDRDELHETGSPFIAHLNDGNEKLVFVPQLNGESSITYFDFSRQEPRTSETELFFKSLFRHISADRTVTEKVGRGRIY